MADDAAFSSPQGKKPNWLLIGGAIVGVVGLAVFLSKSSSSSSGTTAAGSSINAALGSLQEEQMNLLGNVQAGALQNTVNFQSTSGQIAAATKSILDAITSNGTATQDAITGAVNTINANTNSNNQGLMTQLTQAFNSLMASQNNILSEVQSVNQNVTGVGSQVSDVASNVSATQQMVASQLQKLLAMEQEISSGNATASEIDTFTRQIKTELTGLQYLSLGTATGVQAGPTDPRVQQWLLLASNTFTQAANQGF